MNHSIFDCQTFLGLSDAEVREYAEPFVTVDSDKVPDSAYEVLVDKLGKISNVKTVYALELCMRLAPRSFLRKAAEFLTHDDAAVCCTAGRLLESLTRELISADLLQHISSTPVVELFTNHFRTGERISIGTNQEIVSKLLACLKLRMAKQMP